MQTSDRGLMAIAAHEGIVLSPYKDSVGVWTIGIGHTKAAGHPDPAKSGAMTLSEVISLFRHDIRSYEAAVRNAIKVPLEQHEFDALVSFHYNTGAIGKATFVKKLNAGDRAGAIKGIMDWRKPAEIIGRRTAERNLFRDGTYPSPYANIYPVSTKRTPVWSRPERVDLRAVFGSAPKPAPEPVRPSPDPVKPEPAPSRPSGFWPAVLAFLKALVRGGQ